MKKVLITGSNGQLGQCLKALIQDKSYEDVEFVFLISSQLDITDPHAVNQIFEEHKFDYCINCAAYTKVDLAETNEATAQKVNVLGVKNLALACVRYNTVLIHISTDFVFDGQANIPYTEESPLNPLGVYGQTKREGELIVQHTLDNYFILRTSWLYSEYGTNFMKTMVRLGRERNSLNVVQDQIGSPTYAKNLAEVMLQIITEAQNNYGLYHYSNAGSTSWYGFTKAIFEYSDIKINLKGIPSIEYPTPAKRPKYSVLDTSKIKNAFNIKIPHWKDSLKLPLANLKW